VQDPSHPGHIPHILHYGYPQSPTPSGSLVVRRLVPRSSAAGSSYVVRHVYQSDAEASRPYVQVGPPAARRGWDTGDIPTYIPDIPAAHPCNIPQIPTYRTSPTSLKSRASLAHPCSILQILTSYIPTSLHPYIPTSIPPTSRTSESTSVQDPSHPGNIPHILHYGYPQCPTPCAAAPRTAAPRLV
jgi:hypothetical protein